MRRWLTATVLGVAAALVLSGCQAPAGVDGKLVDDWSALGEPKVPVPTAGTCYTGSAEEVLDVTGADLKDAGSCTVEHIAEVAHVGQVTGADASRSSVPAEDSAAGKAAYTDCTTTVREFLGDEWMAGRLYLIVHFPSERQWDGGARHYRCSLVEISSEGGNVVKRNSSLRDGLRGGRPLGVGCVNDFGKDAKSVDRIDFVDCDAKHTAEFSGVYTVTPPGRPYPGDDALDKLAMDGCERLAARYVGLSSTDIPTGLAWLYWGEFKEGWGRGNQSFRCYVGVFDRNKPIRGGATLKGLGSKPIPR